MRFVKHKSMPTHVNNPRDRNVKSSNASRMKSECYKCGGTWPHAGQCPASARKCNNCKRLGTMPRNVVNNNHRERSNVILLEKYRILILQIILMMAILLL